MDFSVEKTAWGDQLDDSRQLNLVYRVFPRINLSTTGSCSLSSLLRREGSQRQSNKSNFAYVERHTDRSGSDANDETSENIFSSMIRIMT